jgi:hypothetical protein
MGYVKTEYRKNEGKWIHRFYDDSGKHVDTDVDYDNPLKALGAPFESIWNTVTGKPE